MRKITKGVEPLSLKKWKSHNNGTYNYLTHIERLDIRASCLKEQYYLCAYCCQSINDENKSSKNEHVVARAIAPNRSLDYSNIVASCTTPGQCDNAHGSQPFQLTPFMQECEVELEFSLSGRVLGLTDRAKETIRVLNLGDTELNNRSLIEKRKQLTYSILFTNGINPNDGLDDNELLEMVIDDITAPKNGRLEAFSPVVVNILKSWIA